MRTTEFVQGKTTRWGVAWTFNLSQMSAGNAVSFLCVGDGLTFPHDWIQSSKRIQAGKMEDKLQHGCCNLGIVFFCLVLCSSAQESTQGAQKQKRKRKRPFQFSISSKVDSASCGEFCKTTAEAVLSHLKFLQVSDSHNDSHALITSVCLFIVCCSCLCLVQVDVTNSSWSPLLCVFQCDTFKDTWTHSRRHRRQLQQQHGKLAPSSLEQLLGLSGTASCSPTSLSNGRHIDSATSDDDKSSQVQPFASDSCHLPSFASSSSSGTVKIADERCEECARSLLLSFAVTVSVSETDACTAVVSLECQEPSKREILHGIFTHLQNRFRTLKGQSD